jgi:peptidyl-dipeptidase A
MKLLTKRILVLSLGLSISLGANQMRSQEQPKLVVTDARHTATKIEVSASEADFDNFYINYVKMMSKAYRESALAYFNASIASNEDNWNKAADADKEVNKILSDKGMFQQIKAFKASKEIKSLIKKRQIEVLYNEFAPKQIEIKLLNELTEMGTKIENKYSNYRTEVNGKKLSDNEVEEILKNSTNNAELEAVWTSQKKIGDIVAKDIIALVKKRNELARSLGFDNYHTMSLTFSEQDPKEIEKLFDELDDLTASAFNKEKAKMDAFLAKRLNIKENELMPWDYQNRFFQEAPQIYNVDLDKYYANQNLVAITEAYYKGLGLPIDDMVKKSDLFEKPNKNQHAYCINIDRDELDIRVLCNVKPDANWMGTLLHEFGHALYEKHYAKDLPWNLKSPAHIFTTEAIAMLFGRFSNNPQWMQDVLNVPEKEAKAIAEEANNTLRLQQLVFSRWSQVMYRFEKALYADPDQDLNTLWWTLVEKYQNIKKPEGRNQPDWATKIHIATSPCYYHNYHLGELFASQLYYTIAKKIGKDGSQTLSFNNQKEVGKFLIDNVFSVGAKYKWEDMIKKATGEKLTPKYYALQFVK